MEATRDESYKVALFKSSVTADREVDDRYLKVLNENELRGISVPTLAFQFQLDELKQCLLQPEKFSGLILTSQRSVESIEEALPELPDRWKQLQHYCVGVQTRETASELLGLTKLMGDECGNALSLSSLIVKESKHGDLPLLFPCSSLKLDTLPTILGEHNIPVKIVNSYVTIPHPQLEESIIKLDRAVPDFLVFFSPSGVNFARPYLGQYEWMHKTKVISIGKTTAQALETAGIPVARICVKPTPDDLVNALKSLLHQ